MGLQELVEVDVLKMKWVYFKNLVDSFELLKMQMASAITDLEGCELYTGEASTLEKALISKYKGVVNGN